MEPSQQRPPVVRLRGAVALLGRFPALSGVDLDVDAGEIVLVRGPNGAGKTSLLRACAGLLRVTSGTAEVLGCDLVADPGSVRPMVGLLAHATHLYDDLDAVENVRFRARAAAGGTRSAGLDAEVRAALDRVGFPTRLHDVAVQRCSTGQRRRVSLAAMIVRRPRLWLLDEPHAGLDAAGRDLLDGLLVEAAAAGATVLFASHELDRAEAVAHRSVTLVGGAVHDGAST